MGLLNFFGIYSPEERLSLDIHRFEDIRDDCSKMMTLLKDALKDIDSGKVDKLEHELFDAKKTDMDIIKAMNVDDPGYSKAVNILDELAESIDKLNSTHNGADKHLKELIVTAENTVNELTREEVSRIKGSSQFLSDYDYLMKSTHLTREDIDSFEKTHSNFIKAKPNKKLCNRFLSKLNKRLSVVILQPGPVMKERELGYVRSKLGEYFHSPIFKSLLQRLRIPANKKIIVGIFGSLVTGYASQYSKYAGLPTDVERTSDVDIGIVLDDEFISSFISGSPDVMKKGIYYGPFHESHAHKTGPFSELYQFLNPLSFAGRTDRKIGFIIVNFDFFNNNLKDENPIILGEYST